MSILIAEDNSVNRRILDLNLRKHGFQTVLTTTGKEALDYLSSNQDVELIITDIMMPEMDGITLIQKIKENSDLKDIPIIVCTARKDVETVKEIALLGAVNYIVKPILASVLLQKVREALGISEGDSEYI